MSEPYTWRGVWSVGSCRLMVSGAAQAVLLWASCSWQVCESKVFIWPDEICHTASWREWPPPKGSTVIPGVKLQGSPAQAPKEPAPSCVKWCSLKPVSQSHASFLMEILKLLSIWWLGYDVKLETSHLALEFVVFFTRW